MEFKPYKNLLVSEDGTEIINTITNYSLMIHIRESTGERYISFKDDSGRKHTYNVKNIVYRAFIGRYQAKFIVDHKDSNVANNHYSNLQLVLKKGKTIDINRLQSHEDFIAEFYKEYFVTGRVTGKADRYMSDRKDRNHSVALDELFVAVSTFDGRGDLEEYCLGRIRMRLSSEYSRYKDERTADIDEYKEVIGSYQLLHDDTDEFVEKFCEILTDNQKEFLLAMYNDEDLSLKEYARRKGVTPQSLTKVRRQLQKKYFLFLQGVDIKEEANKRKSIAKSIGVIKRDDRGRIVAEYTSIMDCCRFECIPQTTLRKHLDTGKLFEGYYWERKE